MQYEREGNWRKIVRVTGPKHNFLAVALSDLRTKAIPKVEVLGRREPPRLRAEDVLTQVKKGVAQANTEFGVHFNIVAVRYVSDDTPDDKVYRQLAREIVRRAVAEQSETSQRLAAG